MKISQLIKKVTDEVITFCHQKGYEEKEGVNNFVPHDTVCSFGMAKQILALKEYDLFISVAPEGYIYSYFFELQGVSTIEVFVDYPPVNLRSPDDLSIIEGKKILIIEDDIIGGATVRLILKELEQYKPAELGLYLGHNKGFQKIENIPCSIEKTFIAEDFFDCSTMIETENGFVEFFSERFKDR